VEMFFSMLNGYDEDSVRYQVPEIELKNKYMASYGEIKDIDEIIIENYKEGFNIILKFNPNTTIWRFPIETVSQSEAGLERTYQSSAVVPNWRLKLKPNEKFSAEILLEVLEGS
jgi:alpha-amylase